MKSSKAAELVQSLLHDAGIRVGGDNPWDIHIYNPRLYECILIQPSLGMGEAYMQGWWDCPQLDEFFCRVLRAKLDERILQHPLLIFAAVIAKINRIKHHLFNYQSKKKALEVGRHHYDIGNDLYECMLDAYMNYTCAYWRRHNTLEGAQRAKLDLICKKLGLKAGMRVLDIGCGFGSFAKFAAENYKVNVVGITISQQQLRYAQENCKGLPVEIRFQDYREVNETFDRICSVGMFEHVGYKNYRTYMEKVHQYLKDDGLFLLHTVGTNISTVHGDEWADRYIFPNGMLPSLVQIACGIEGLFVMEDWHNISADYDKTLSAWHTNFNRRWHHLKNDYSEEFRRMWNYYLLSFAGSFRARTLQLWQVVLAKKGVPGGYLSIR